MGDLLSAGGGGGGAAILPWTAGTYSAGALVVRGPYVWRATTTTTEDPYTVEGNLGLGADWALQTSGAMGSNQTSTATIDGAPRGRALLIANVTGGSTSIYRQRVEAGFLGKMIVADCLINGTADGLSIGVFDSSLAQTATNVGYTTGFYGVEVDIFNSRIINLINGVAGTNVSYSSATASNAGTAYSRWYLKMIQNGANWDLELLRSDARVASTGISTGFDQDQEDDLAPLARFTNVARPAYTNWRMAFGARTGGSAGNFAVRDAAMRNIISGAWVPVSRIPTGISIGGIAGQGYA